MQFLALPVMIFSAAARVAREYEYKLKQMDGIEAIQKVSGEDLHLGQPAILPATADHSQHRNTRLGSPSINSLASSLLLLVGSPQTRPSVLASRPWRREEDMKSLKTWRTSREDSPSLALRPWGREAVANVTRRQKTEDERQDLNGASKPSRKTMGT
ncbi:hypothetical protein BC629DRAFT_1594173 [Irpex lacteus]|nr:hypothetical protein BC629DRAFT_1594173 [Irpex lacteus]